MKTTPTLNTTRALKIVGDTIGLLLAIEEALSELAENPVDSAELFEAVRDLEVLHEELNRL
jgi:hypothetical protein